MRTKEGWLEVIEAKLKELSPLLELDDYTRTRLAMAPIKTLAVVEHLLASIEMTVCSVGCGDCGSCKLHRKQIRRSK